MAANLQLTAALTLAEANAIEAAIDAGTAAVIEIYTGSQPANANASITGTLLSEHACSATFGVTSNSGQNALITANAIADDSSANNSGNAGYWVLKTQTGGTVIAMGSCGTSSADMVMNTVAIVSGSPVSITSCVFTVAAN